MQKRIIYNGSFLDPRKKYSSIYSSKVVVPHHIHPPSRSLTLLYERVHLGGIYQQTPLSMSLPQSQSGANLGPTSL